MWENCTSVKYLCQKMKFIFYVIVYFYAEVADNFLLLWWFLFFNKYFFFSNGDCIKIFKKKIIKTFYINLARIFCLKTIFGFESKTYYNTPFNSKFGKSIPLKICSGFKMICSPREKRDNGKLNKSPILKHSFISVKFWFFFYVECTL